jgi:hypothetical protein
MSHIVEDTVTRLREQITEGARITSSPFQDHRTPFGPMEWFTADAVAFDESGRLTVTYHWITERGAKRVREAYFDADDMIALTVPGTPENPARLILAGGGYMVACDGGNLRSWDVYAPDGTRIAEGRGTADARYMLAEYAPEMIWVHKGDGKWVAQGHGREWLVTRHGRNPEYTAHMPMSRAWLYALMSRPVGAHEYVEVVEGCATPEEARAAAPSPQEAAGR